MTRFTVFSSNDLVALVVDPLTALALAQLMDDADLAGTDQGHIESIRDAARSAGHTAPAVPPKPRAHLRVVGGDPS